MNKTVVITIGVVLALAAGGVVVWLLVASTQPVKQPASTGTNNGTNQYSNDSNQAPGPAANNVPLSTEGNTNTIQIENMAFSPANTTVKKGTTITWVNKDSVSHNVVSDSDAPAGGPPKSAPLFDQGGTFQFTYNTVGTFQYHCSAHPNMQGTITVTE